MSIFLIGYRGTGKSTVAQWLAQRLGYDVVDADAVLESRAGKSIKEIFASDGESAFRALEAAILRELVQRPRTVVALGGGVVLAEDNRRLLRGVSPVVWLTAPAEVLWQRINADPTTGNRRPNLTAAGGVAEITELLARREPWYRECATLIIHTADKSPGAIADEILLNLAANPWKDKQ